jgi:hypothetical protein
MKNINIYALYVEGQVFVNMDYENAFVKCVMGVLIVNMISLNQYVKNAKEDPFVLIINVVHDV